MSSIFIYLIFGYLFMINCDSKFLHHDRPDYQPLRPFDYDNVRTWRSSLFPDIMQLRSIVSEVSVQPISLIFKGLFYP